MIKNSDTPDSTKDVGSGDDADSAIRRSLLKVGITAGSVLASRQALSSTAAPYLCTPSGQQSGNLSQGRDAKPDCGGTGNSPGCLRQHASAQLQKWVAAGLAAPSIKKKTSKGWVLLNAPGLIQIPDLQDPQQYKVKTTDGQSLLGSTLQGALGLSVGIDSILIPNTPASMWELLSYGHTNAFSAPFAKFARHISAALINAKFYGPSYPVTVDQVKAMWSGITAGGTWSPGFGPAWNEDAIMDYLDSTWGGENDVCK